MNVGDKVFLKAVGNNARGRKEVLIEEYQIVKIGRKYFEVSKENSSWTIKFHIDGKRQVTDYTPDWSLYFSKQEILDEQEVSKLTGSIKKVFDTYGKVNLTLDQLRRINEIINE
jgi:hypothetical protein